MNGGSFASGVRRDALLVCHLGRSHREDSAVIGRRRHSWLIVLMLS